VAEPSEIVAEAAIHADLGLPLPESARLRFPKRVVGRLARMFTSHQRAFNHQQLAFNRTLIDMAARYEQTVTTVETRRREQEARMQEQETRLQEQVVLLRNELYRVTQAAEMRTGNDLGSLRTDLHHVHQAALDSQARAAGIGETLRATEERVSRLDGRIDALSGDLARAQQRTDALARTQQAKLALVDLFLREARRETPAPSSAPRAPEGLGDFYSALQEAFRGPSESVAELQRPYLDDVAALTSPGPVLDLGSGRGEWLELLSEVQVDAYGIDRDLFAVENGRERGLDLRHEDALGHLASIPEGSVGVVSAFHLVEHLDFGDVMLLLDQAVRVLRPGGLLLIETPNPENVLVASTTFHLDPTHRMALPPMLLEFLVASRGFDQIEVRHLHPALDQLETGDSSEAARKTIQPALERLNTLLFGPQDYAVLARRSSS
jgi:SAM-dependent methyltransferase